MCGGGVLCFGVFFPYFSKHNSLRGIDWQEIVTNWLFQKMQMFCLKLGISHR